MTTRETIVALAAKCGVRSAVLLEHYKKWEALTDSEQEEIEQVEAFYRAAYAAGMEDAATVCDDLWQNDATAYDCREAIREKASEVTK